MITKNIVRLALVALGAFLACAPVSRAAEPRQGGRQGQPRRMDAQAMLQRMAEQLELTAEQKGKLKPILEKQYKEMQALRQDTSLSREDRRAKYGELRNKYTPKIKAILTADQAAKWEKAQQEMRNRRRQRSQQ